MRTIAERAARPERASRDAAASRASATAAGGARAGHEFARIQVHSRGVVQRDPSFDSCSAAQERRITDTHTRAMEMVNNAFTQLTKPTLDPVVERALRMRFSSTNFIVQINVGGVMADLRREARSPQYECQSRQIGTRRGWSMWCVPFTDIELYPDWFSDTDIDMRAKTLIHEWCHRYICLADLGYLDQDPEAIRHGTVRALYNADSYAYLAYDIRKVT
jgi:hypothetical protein